MSRLCVSCGNEIPNSTPLSVYNVIIDKCESCYIENTPLLDTIKSTSKVFAIRINKNLTLEQIKNKIIKLAGKIRLYISSN